MIITSAVPLPLKHAEHQYGRNDRASTYVFRV